MWLVRIAMRNSIQNHRVIPMTVLHVSLSTITATIYHQLPVHRIPMTDNKLNIRKFLKRPQKSTFSFTFQFAFVYLFIIGFNSHRKYHSYASCRRSRKRRSNRRKATQQNMQSMQNVCNAGLAPLNEVATSFDVNPNSSYVMNPNAPDTSSPSKKRKLSSQDLPGPSSYHTKNSPNQTPMSEFYHSLLASSYQDNFNGMCWCCSMNKLFFANIFIKGTSSPNRF